MHTLLYALAVVACVVAAPKLYKLLTLRYARGCDMHGRVCIVTGGNAGLGFETAVALARMGARVVLACRSTERGEMAARQIRSVVGKEADVVVEPLDVTSLASIAKFIASIRARYTRLDVLLNNAGVALMPYETTVDDLELHWATNFIGVVALTEGLLPLLRATPHSRAVVVGSITHRIFKKTVMPTMPTRDAYTQVSAYGISKLAVTMYYFHLAERLRGTNASAFIADPGTAATSIHRFMPRILHGLSYAFVSLFFKSAVEGAQSSICACCDPALENSTGLYIANCAPDTPSRAAVATELYEPLLAAARATVAERTPASG